MPLCADSETTELNVVNVLNGGRNSRENARNNDLTGDNADEAQDNAAPHEEILAVKWSPCGSFVVTSSKRGSLAVFDAQTKGAEMIHRFGNDFHDGWVDCLRFADSYSYNCEYGCDLHSGNAQGDQNETQNLGQQPQQEQSGKIQESMEHFEFLLGAGGFDRCVVVWKLRIRRKCSQYGIDTHRVNAEVCQKFKDHRGPIRDLKFSKLQSRQVESYPQNSAASSHPHSRKLVSTSYSNAVYIWDIEDGTLLAVLGRELHSLWVWSIDVSLDNRLVSSSVNNDVHVWDIHQMTLISTLRGHTDVVPSVAFDSSGTLIATASKDRSIIIWSEGRGTSGCDINDRNGSCSRNSSNSINNNINSGANLWESPENPQGEAEESNNAKEVYVQIAKLAGFHTSGIRTICFNCDSTFVGASSWDGYVSIWDWRSKKLVSSIGAYDDDIVSMSFLADSAHFGSLEFYKQRANAKMKRIQTQAQAQAQAQASIPTPTPTPTPTKIPTPTQTKAQTKAQTQTKAQNEKNSAKEDECFKNSANRDNEFSPPVSESTTPTTRLVRILVHLVNNVSVMQNVQLFCQGVDDDQATAVSLIAKLDSSCAVVPGCSGNGSISTDMVGISPISQSAAIYSSWTYCASFWVALVVEVLEQMRIQRKRARVRVRKVKEENASMSSSMALATTQTSFQLEPLSLQILSFL